MRSNEFRAGDRIVSGAGICLGGYYSAGDTLMHGSMGFKLKLESGGS